MIDLLRPPGFTNKLQAQAGQIFICSKLSISQSVVLYLQTQSRSGLFLLHVCPPDESLHVCPHGDQLITTPACSASWPSLGLSMWSLYFFYGPSSSPIFSELLTMIQNPTLPSHRMNQLFTKPSEIIGEHFLYSTDTEDSSIIMTKQVSLL